MATLTFPHAETDSRIISAEEVARIAIEKAITDRRRARGDWTAVRIKSEVAGAAEVDGRACFERRVWARKGKEEFTIKSASTWSAVVECESEHVACYLPESPNAFAKMLRYSL